MGKNKKVMRLLQKIPDVLAWVGLGPAFVGALVMLIIMVVGVISRYVFNRPLAFVDEYIGFMLAFIIMLGLAYALKTRGHIAVDVLVRMLPRRVAAYLELATLFISVGFVTLILYGATMLTIKSFITGRATPTTVETPLWTVQWVMPVGLSFFVIGIIAEIVSKIRALRALKKKVEPALDTGEADSE